MPPTQRLPRWMKPANRVVMLLHRLGLRLGTIHVLTVTGRTSGRPRSTPVSPLTVGGTRYVIAGLPGSSWAENARADGHGQLSHGRRTEAIELVEVTDPGTARQVMEAFPAEVPHGVPFFVRIGLVSGADPAEFAAAADRVAVFEIRPAPPG